MNERLDEFDHEDAKLTAEDRDFLDDLDEDIPDAEEFYEFDEEPDDHPFDSRGYPLQGDDDVSNQSD